LHGKGRFLLESAPTSDHLEEADQHKARILAKLGGVDAPSRNVLLEDLDIGPEDLERHLSDLLEGGYVFKQDGPKGNAGWSLTKKAKDFLLRKV
jgi:hypothetical protein